MGIKVQSEYMRVEVHSDKCSSIKVQRRKMQLNLSVCTL